MSISAEQFSLQGDKYLGCSYEEMDCQEFYERCAADAGLKKDLKGSNAWYREFLKNGWTGSPEDCRKIFGSIPKGATLFIHAFDGGEEKHGYHDGLGNASHIGIKTGRGKGAIHSSSTRKCVAESAFSDKTIPNGGWNMVGLHPWFSYGEKIDDILSKTISGQTGSEEVNTGNMETYIVTAERGETVRLRERPSTEANTVAKIAIGTPVWAEESDTSGWMTVATGDGKTGFMMTAFLNRMENIEETVLVSLPYDAAIALRDALFSALGVG